MAYLHGLQLTGRLGEFSAYKRWDSDKIIFRRKGGGSKEKIMTSKTCVRTRENMKEFGGRAKMASCVRRAMWPQRVLADYNFIGSINPLVMPAQELDTTGVRGRRAIRLSAAPRILEGFSLNEKTTFDMIVQTSVHGKIMRDTRTATVELPALLSGINFTPEGNHPMFCIQVVLGIVPDLAYNEKMKKYEPPHWCSGTVSQTITTPWYVTVKGAPASTLSLALDFAPPDDAYSLILSIGICFGQPGRRADVDQVERVGAAKILATA